MAKKSVGIIINPIAGIGGRVGLKGSDGEDTLERALALGAKPESQLRAKRALSALCEIKDEIDIYTYGGDMGETLLLAEGFAPIVLGRPKGEKTSAADTIEAAQAMLRAKVNLILFAGGDGTARNIHQAVQSSVPVIGIPAGVKIHSAVYATTPENAGVVARDYLRGEIETIQECEVMDIDEDLFRQGRVSAKLYGYMSVPVAGGRVQRMKDGGGDEDDRSGMAAHIVDRMKEDVLYIIGPGSTTASIMEDMELENTLLGVDVVKNKKLVASDATEAELFELLKDPEQKAKIVVTVIGGQGYLFGRGNQQLSPRIIRRVGIDNIHVASTPSKLVGLRGKPFLVDTGDAELDKELKGYVEVVLGYGHTAIYDVSND